LPVIQVAPTVWHGNLPGSGINLVRMLGGLSDPLTRRDMTLQDLTRRLYMLGYAMLPHQVALACFHDESVPGGYRLDTALIRGEVRFRDQTDVPIRNSYLNHARQGEDILYWPELPADWYDPGDVLAETVASCRSLLSLPTRAYHKAEVHFLADKPRAFTEDSIQLAAIMTHLSVAAFENLELFELTKTLHDQLDGEMRQLERLQHSLLPRELPRIEGYELDAYYRASSRAGGDYYDFFPLPDGRWGVMIADVSGHGAAAAVGMAMMRVLLYAYPGEVTPPGSVLAALNASLHASLMDGSFVTALYAALDPRDGSLTYACAGHNPGLVWRQSQAGFESLSQVGGVPLGLFPGRAYDEHTVRLEHGDMLVLYTDGITEARNAANELFGDERLLAALTQRITSAAPALLEGLVNEVRAFSKTATPHDDQTLLVLRRL
jgi:sigma-B regulation protein RsbU (phosphoserine phosphatase)